MRLHQEQPRKKLQEVNNTKTKRPTEPNFILATEYCSATSLKGESQWEDTVYVVVSEKNPDIPVYEVKSERGGKSRTGHKNLLLPCDSLPVEKSERKEQDKRKRGLK